MLDDNLRHAYFPIIEIAQRAVGLNVGNVDDAEIDLEAMDKIDDFFASNTEVARATPPVMITSQSG